MFQPASLDEMELLRKFFKDNLGSVFSSGYWIGYVKEPLRNKWMNVYTAEPIPKGNNNLSFPAC